MDNKTSALVYRPHHLTISLSEEAHNYFKSYNRKLSQQLHGNSVTTGSSADRKEKFRTSGRDEEDGEDAPLLLIVKSELPVEEPLSLNLN
ncbi:hypothetical protein TNCV_1077551 [Trichonephila clavipes]|uniref:Uncharacterized protein n=1 Tax=Trichonephila clavipes TaxID=2585209 RepID=A0A8X6RRF4_TRICX|nr:hypothetical protein TNCV_1077551 [Trichonephila clavipes]